MPRTVKGLIKERKEKQEKKVGKLAEIRKSQWEDELLKCVISALPRSTPDKIKEILDDIKKDSPCDFKPAQEALDAIGFLKQHTNGTTPEKFWSEPHRILWAETLSVCAKQSYKWKFIPLSIFHPFVARVCILTAATGKRIPRNDMMQMEQVAKGIYENMAPIIDKICSTAENKSEGDDNLIESLREIYPDILTSHDGTAINDVLDVSVKTRVPEGVPEWVEEACTDEDGQMDGYFLCQEDIEVSEGVSDVDDRFEGQDARENVKGNGSDESFAIESLSISGDDHGVPSTPAQTRLRETKKLPTPVTKPITIDSSKEEDKDFTSSLSQSLIDSVLNKGQRSYQATPPPPRRLGKYSMVAPMLTPSTPSSPSAPMESSPKTKPTFSRNQFETVKEATMGPKRMASPSTLQPPKLQRVENSQAVIRQLRRELAQSNRKVECMGQCITDMQTRHAKELQQQQQQQQMKQQRTWRRTSRQLQQQHGSNHDGFLESRQQYQQQHQQQQPRRDRARSTSDLPFSPIRNTLGPRQSAANRTAQLIQRESLGGIVRQSDRLGRTNH